MAENGTGATITFGTSSYTCKLLNVSHSGVERTAIQTSHHESDEHTFIPGELVNYGQLDVEIEWVTGVAPPIDAAPEIITLTSATGATLTGTGFLTGYDSEIPLEDRVTGSFVVKWSGKPVHAPASP